jgi:Zn-dependent protease with chaperone function
VVLYTIFFAIALFVVSLPFSYYVGYLREHAYGLSNQTFGKWLRDTLIGAGLTAGVTALVLVPLLYLLLRRTRRWWLYLALLSVPFGLFTQIIAPIWIAPLFNQFEPMRDRALERRILSVANRAGISGARIYQVNKSVDTPAVNAYVSGWLGTERIVLWDTALRKLDEPQLLFVLGHEMGHYVLHHVTAGIGLGFVLTLLGLFVVDRVGRRLIERGSARHRVTRLADVASLPLLLLLLSLVDLALSPVTNLYSRHLEHEADRFGLELLHDNRAAAQMFVTLQGENLVNPRPGTLYQLWLSDHPSLAERVEFANTYRPWVKGERGRYEGKFKEAQ